MIKPRQINEMIRIFLASLIILMMGIGEITAQDPQNPPLIFRVVAVSMEEDEKKSESNELEIYVPMKVYVPTAFTPNGDGLNDSFGAVGEGIEDYKLVVYNRWGEVIFSSSAISKKWDGNHKGKPVPFGAYTYELMAGGKEFGQIQRSGYVTVVK